MQKVCDSAMCEIRKDACLLIRRETFGITPFAAAVFDVDAVKVRSVRGTEHAGYNGALNR